MLKQVGRNRLIEEPRLALRGDINPGDKDGVPQANSAKVFQCVTLTGAVCCSVSSAVIFVPLVSGNVQIHMPVSNAKIAASEIPPPRPYRSATIAITTGVKNWIPRARLNAVPIAVFRIMVGKSSENSVPFTKKSKLYFGSALYVLEARLISNHSNQLLLRTVSVRTTNCTELGRNIGNLVAGLLPTALHQLLTTYQNASRMKEDYWLSSSRSR